MKRTTYLAIGVAVLAVLLVSVVVFRRYLPYTGVPLAPRQPPAVVLSMEDAYLVGLGRGGKLWSVKAKRIEMAQNRSTTTITGMTDGRIYDQGKVALKVKAGHAEYDVFGRNLRLSNGITIRGLQGETVDADGAVWNSFTSTLRSKGRVSFRSKLSKVDADSLLLDLKRNQVSMWNVHMRLNLDEAAEFFGEEAGSGAY